MQPDVHLIDGHRPELGDGIARMPASRLLGLRVLGFGAGTSAIELPVRPEVTFDGLVVQGGIVGTLADYAAVSAATAGQDVGRASSTTSFQVYNLEPARGERLVAYGRIVKKGRSQSVAAADVYAIDGSNWTLCATALATCYHFDLPR